MTETVDRVLPAMRAFAAGIANAPDIERVTISGAGKTVTLPGGATRARDDAPAADPDAEFPIPDSLAFIDPAWVAAGGAANARNAPLLDYCPAPTIAEAGKTLIARHRTRFPHLHKPFDHAVAFFWKRVGGDAKGRMTLGTCQKTPPLMRTMTRARWVIWIAADNCEGLTNRQMEALIFHELLHTGMDDKAQPQPQGHDLEEFRAVVEEYGFLFHDLRAFRDVMQLRLFEDGEGDGVSASGRPTREGGVSG